MVQGASTYSFGYFHCLGSQRPSPWVGEQEKKDEEEAEPTHHSDLNRRWMQVDEEVWVRAKKLLPSNNWKEEQGSGKAGRVETSISFFSSLAGHTTCSFWNFFMFLTFQHWLYHLSWASTAEPRSMTSESHVQGPHPGLLPAYRVIAQVLTNVRTRQSCAYTLSTQRLKALGQVLEEMLPTLTRDCLSWVQEVMASPKWSNYTLKSLQVRKCVNNLWHFCLL